MLFFVLLFFLWKFVWGGGGMLRLGAGVVPEYEWRVEDLQRTGKGNRECECEVVVCRRCQGVVDICLWRKRGDDLGGARGGGDEGGMVEGWGCAGRGVVRRVWGEVGRCGGG